MATLTMKMWADFLEMIISDSSQKNVVPRPLAPLDAGLSDPHVPLLYLQDLSWSYFIIIDTFHCLVHTQNVL